MKSFTEGLDAKELAVCRLVADDAVAAGDAVLGFVNDPHLWRVAAENEVQTHAAHSVERSLGAGVPSEPGFEKAWREHAKVEARIVGYMNELERVGERLGDHGIPVVALKNGGITRGIYPCCGCSPMGDIDLLVSPRDFRKAHALMVELGFEFEFRSELEEADLDEAEQSGGAEYWRTLEGGERLWLELQWRPVAGRWIRPDQEPPAEELVARSSPIAGSSVRLLAPEDNLLQVVLHTAKHSYVRAPGFRLHTDVDRIVRRQTIDWDAFVEACKTLQVKTAAYFSLVIPAEVFGTPVPSEVLARLRPSRWKERSLRSQIQRAGLLYPERSKFGKLSFVIFTALLYDDARGLLRGMFPDRAWMMERYGFKSPVLLPYHHVRRLFDLAFRRASL